MIYSALKYSFLLALFSACTYALCCEKIGIIFKIPKFRTCCYFGAYNICDKICLKYICKDALDHPGFYCATGSCNFIGCNCDGQCFEGNTIENFKKRYPRVHVIKVLENDSDYKMNLNTTLAEWQNLIDCKKYDGYLQM